MRWDRPGLAVGLGALLAGCGGSGTQSHGVIRVTPAGQIGPLHVNRSGRADVVAAFGHPDAENSGRYSPAVPFDALGYGCKGNEATNRVGIPKCPTVFYVIPRSDRLPLLYTRSSRFEFEGIHPGTPTEAVERQLDERPGEGCYYGYDLKTRTGFLVLWLTSARGSAISTAGKGKPRPHVGFLVVHEPRLDSPNNPGVLDCIDS